MKTCKKALAGLSALCLLALLLAACGAAPLPEGMDAEALKDRSLAIVDLANARDYEALAAEFRADLQTDGLAENLAAINPYLDEAGAFVEVKTVQTAGYTQNDVESALCVVSCKYENKTLNFQIIFDLDSELTGLFL